MQLAIEHALANENNLLEFFASAFLEATGLRPHEAELVREARGEKIVWYFQKRNGGEL